MHFHGLQLGPALYRVASAPALQAGSSLGPVTGTSGLTLAPTPALPSLKSLRAPCPCSFFTRFLQRTVDVPLTVL